MMHLDIPRCHGKNTANKPAEHARMTSKIAIDPALKHFIDTEALPGTGLEAAAFWAGFASVVEAFAPRNKALLERRGGMRVGIAA